MKDKLEFEQTCQIEQQKRKGEAEVEIKLKDIEIERLKRKTNKDTELLVESNKQLEDRLNERSEEIRLLKEVKPQI